MFSFFLFRLFREDPTGDHLDLLGGIDGSYPNGVDPVVALLEHGYLPSGRGKCRGLEVGDTVGSALARLVADYPALGQHIFDDDGNLEAYINVFVNGRSMRFLDGLNTSLSEDDVLAIFPPVAGG